MLLIDKKKKHFEEEEVVKKLCSVNGLSYEKIASEGSSIRSLEIFFSGFPRMVGLSYFPNLCQLTIVDQNINQIEGLDGSPMLQELWIVQCHLTEISGLQNCNQLEKLYLYDNQIQEINNLELQGNLIVLWLNNNCITKIQGLNTMNNLRELNLSDNSIEKIGHNLDPNVNLEILNLSGNKICFFKELTQLARLPHLRELVLNDPTSGLNPVCQLCNYTTHILYHMPGLQRLDNWDVSCKQVKDAAESAVMKKLMYYNMRVRSTRRNLTETQAELTERKKSLMQPPEEWIRTLSHALKNLEQELSMLPYGPKSSTCKMETDSGGLNDHKDALTETTDLNTDSSDPGLEHKILLKIEALRERLQQWTRRMDEVQVWYEQELLQAMEQTEYLVQFLLMELESVGNIRLEEGCSTDPWYTFCCHLLLSRFSPSDYKTFSIANIKINRVFRIHNSALRLRFEDKLHSLYASEESVAVSQNYRHRLEYLFYMADPEKCGKEQTLCVLEEGLKTTHQLKVLEGKGAVPLSNSLAVTEQPRIKFVLQQASQCHSMQKPDKIPFRHGHVIICKVFVGNSMPIGDDELGNLSRYPKVYSVYYNLDAKSRSAASDERPSSTKTPSGPEGRTPRRRRWFVFDHELVLPEYIIHFEYITANREDLSCYGQGDDYPSADNATDKAALSMEPALKPQPKLLSLDKKTLLSVAGAHILSQISELNLHGNSLSKIKEISSFSTLRHLTISFNKFTCLDDVSHMPNLEVLDASFNELVTLEGLRCLGRLRQLDVSWNKLTKAREDAGVLRKHTPVLLKLDTRCNAWSKPEAVRMTILGRVTTLTHLDGVMVTEEEADEALQMATVFRINQAAVLAHSRTNSERPRSLSLLSTAQLLSRLGPAPWGPGRELEPDWTAKITTLNLENQRLSKLYHLDKLVNLRWASFNHNNISKLGGLDTCLKLEELSMKNNSISSLNGLTRLPCLRNLSIDENQLSSLDGSVLDQLPALTFLSAENNCITSLNGIKNVRSLLELYVGGNQISTSRDIYYLKGLENLIILDLYGNPIVEKLENYRTYVVYHLPSLKALDGAAVDASESENAKNMFRGRLTTDTVAEKLGYSNYKEITCLTLQSCSIRMVDLSPPELFVNLRSVNLEHNNLTSFSGLIHLPNIKALCLNYNHIESILPRPKPQAHLSSRQILYSKVHSSGYGQQSPSRPDRDSRPASSLEPLMGSLEVLHLSHNGISNMANLQLSRLTNLRALFLQGNEISQVEGLEGLHQLRELVLDRNRIKALAKNSFAAQNVLLELHLAENRIRELNHLHPLTELHKLFLDMNKLQDITELEKLDVLPTLTELSIAGNPVARNSQHRAAVVVRLSQLQVLDGIVVTLEERTRAELLSGDPYQSSQHPGAHLPTGDIHLPGLLPLWPPSTTLRGINGGLHNAMLGHDTPPSSADDNHHTHRYQKHKTNVGRSIQTDTNFRQSRKTRNHLPTTGLLSDGSSTCSKQDQDHRFPYDGKPLPM
ncbi:leucine-rich repeat-containing protein 9 isoform X2 [Girardinichthys multiradiatus]|uniref:leucine-rich repeat-containing protein 9 isoform X2 n=1 Tax=Girardinichthys multiradiatus TaxID=208333 RepID=UPI001FAD11F4|nr:leucine-rich repeat-containing protein 9 isoform X2 [Girardinichthys multiradiatus]